MPRLLPPSSIAAAALSAAGIVFAICTTASPSMAAAADDSAVGTLLLRGNNNQGDDSSWPLLSSTMTTTTMTETHHAMNPFEMAAAEAANNHHQRGLANGEKRKKRKELKAQNGGGSGSSGDSGGGSSSNNDGECSGSRPKKCGCPNVFQSDYRGKKSTTQNGSHCAPWADNHVKHYPDEGLEHGAVCRNPAGVAGRAWCFTSGGDLSSWDYCDIDRCDCDECEPVSRTDVVVVPGCIDRSRYYQIEDDIREIAYEGSITDDADRVHFLGAIVRLAAHDFMDFDQNDGQNPMGMDGCLDWTSLSNLGLSDVWNEHTPLFKLHRDKYSDVSRPDFWVASAGAVIRMTSIDNQLDLVNTMYWGRVETDRCDGAADRLPSTAGCREVEGVFLERMGLTWHDAVALLGAHTIGRGHAEFSGHHGRWMPNDKAAQVFDKRYYEELVTRAWSPRLAKTDPPLEDWTTGNTPDDPKMMLNTDVCLFYDVDDGRPCCTRATDSPRRCESHENRQCAVVRRDHPRAEAAAAVRKYLGGPTRNDNNDPFYHHFELAWFKAVTNGMHDLKPIMDQC